MTATEMCPMTREAHVVDAVPLPEGGWFHHCVTCGEDWITEETDAEPTA